MTAEQILKLFRPVQEDTVEFLSNPDGSVSIIFEDIHGQEVSMTRPDIHTCMSDRAAYLATQVYGRAH